MEAELEQLADACEPEGDPTGPSSKRLKATASPAIRRKRTLESLIERVPVKRTGDDRYLPNDTFEAMFEESDDCH